MIWIAIPIFPTYGKSVGGTRGLSIFAQTP